MDIVYLCKSSMDENYELRFSLRSAEKNLHFDKVFIIGHKPKFLNNKATHIQVADIYGNKHKNVARKIAVILNDKRISDDFIFMNDDFYLLRKYTEIPYYYNRLIKEWVDRTEVDKAKRHFTGGSWDIIINHLYKKFPNGKFFELHFPIVYNKRMLRDVIRKYDIQSTATIRSHYCNEYKDKLKIQASQDYKIYDATTLKSASSYKDFVSTTDIMAHNPLFKSYINSRFPNPSSYEVVKNK